MSRPSLVRSRRWLAEILVIVFSVFVAVALESAWDERGRKEDARDALEQLAGELRQDRSDLEEVLAEQNALDGLYRDLVRWLSDPSALPNDSVAWGLDSLAYSNRTMYPRRSAWTTMVAGGQLALLDDPALVARLGDLYENANPRLIGNGAGYDEHLFTMVRESVPRVWDREGARLLTENRLETAMLRGQLSFTHRSWNEWYRNYLVEYAAQIDALIEAIGDHLAARGR